MEEELQSGQTAWKPWIEKCKCFFYDQDTDLEKSLWDIYKQGKE